MTSKWDRVKMGEIVLSTEVARTINPLAISFAIRRHRFGHWGKISPVEKAINDRAATCGNGLFSIHETTTKQEFWIISVPGEFPSRSSAILRSYEMEAALESASDARFDEYGYSNGRDIDTYRWEAVKHHLDWGGDSPMAVLEAYSALEAKEFEGCDEAQCSENEKNHLKPHRGTSYAGFRVDLFSQLTSQGFKRDYVKLFVEQLFEA